MRYIRVKFSDGKFRRVPLVDPMRPTDIKEVPENGWIAEEKIDGSLTLMYLIDGAVAYVNRKGVNKTDVYPELTDDEARYYRSKGLSIIQGETYALSGGTDSWEAFLKRDLLQNPTEARQRMRDYPLRFKAFDILMNRGDWIIDRPILERKRMLESIVPKTEEVSVAKYSTQPKRFTERMRRDKTVEGVVFKKLPDGYESGKSKHWRKLKFKKEADVVITGYEKGEGKRKDIGALKVGVYDKKTGGVKEVANVGTGFTDVELRDIKRRLDRGEKLFAKVEYMKVGTQGRLRVPVFKGLREDITTKETHL